MSDNAPDSSYISIISLSSSVLSDLSSALFSVFSSVPLSTPVIELKSKNLGTNIMAAAITAIMTVLITYDLFLR